MKRGPFARATGLQRRAPELTTLAHRRLIEMLEGHGNGVCENHSFALWQLLSGFTEQGLHIRNRRIAYALPCGSGKTLSVVAWIAAQYQLGLGLSVAVSAQQIASLCVIKEALIKAGVPETMIGIRHSYGSAAKYPDTGEDERSIMLGSHSRIRGKDEVPAFCLYKGTTRDLLIWDETLHSTDATTLVLNDADTALMHFAKDGKRPFLQLASSKLQAATQAERIVQRTSPPTLLTLLTPEESEAALAELGHPVFGTHLSRLSHETAQKALKLMRHPVSLLDAGNGSDDVVLMRYQIAIAPELQNIAVLDASYVVSELCKADPTIRDGTTEMMRSFKKYTGVRVRQTLAPTGRSRFDRTSAERVEAIQAGIGSILSIPSDQRILVITYKEEGRKGGDLIGLLKNELARAGVNHDALLPDGSRRVSFTTWGKHTTDNSFADCEHVLLLGVLRMSLSSLAAALAGQRRDECFRLSKKELLNVELSELAGNIMQAMNRGTCRRVDVKGNAMGMTLHLHTKERGLQVLLQAAMPGLQWETIEVKAPTKTEDVTRQIVEHLLAYSAGDARISKQRLFSDLGIQLGKDAKAEAMAEAMTKLREHAWHRFEFPWVEEGRSLVRKATVENAVEFQPSAQQAQLRRMRGRVAS